jgi:hypothetical protein
MEALARNRQSPSTGLAVALWGGGALLAVIFGVAAATSVAAVAGLIGVLVASAVVVAAFTATRWALLALLFLLYSYSGWVVGHTFGGPEVSQVLLLIIIAALAWRHFERTERFSLPGELIAFLILGVAIATSAAFTTDVNASLHQIWDFIGYGLTVVAIVALLDRPVWLRRAVWTVVVAGGALAIVSLLQAGTGAYDNDFGGFAIARPEGAGVFRIGGPLDPNFFGQVLVATAGDRPGLHRGHWLDGFARGPRGHGRSLLPDPSARTDSARHRGCDCGYRRRCGPGLHAIRPPGSNRPVELLGLPGSGKGDPRQ